MAVKEKPVKKGKSPFRRAIFTEDLRRLQAHMNYVCENLRRMDAQEKEE